MDPVTPILVAELDSDLRLRILRRKEAMLRQLRHLRETENAELILLVGRGWSMDRLEVICGLNSFYQIVLGPLASSAREREGVLGNEVPILYGDSLRFDREHALMVRRLHTAFMNAVRDLPVAPSMLTAPHASDLVFRLAAAVRGNAEA
jgi:hypothetical protein